MEHASPTQSHHIGFSPVAGLILLVGWALYLLLSPIYVFKSGLPQPADILLFIISGLGIVLFVMTNRIVFNRVFVGLFATVGLFFATNITYFFWYKDFGFLLSSAYYIYNAMAFGLTILVFREYQEKAVSAARLIISITLIFQVLYLILIDNLDALRNVGTFNNPNQLGYWTLLSASYILLLCHGRRMQWFDIIGFLCAAFIVNETLSRAVAAAFALLTVLFIIRPYISIIAKILIGFIICATVLIQLAIFQNPIPIETKFTNLDRLAQRFIEKKTEDDNVAGRGYDRIINHPEYLILGAGEGAHHRFGSPLEIHSGLGAILFSYGIMGFTIFGLFILTIYQRAHWALWIILFAVMGYGLTHQHVRFTGFWLLMGMTYAMTRYVIPRRAQAFSRPLR